MNFKSAKLLEPFNLKGLELRNRAVMAPMTRARSREERIPNALWQNTTLNGPPPD